MAEPLVPRVVQADRVDNGVVVNFESGDASFYSADLLFKMRPSAVDLNFLDPDTI